MEAKAFSKIRGEPDHVLNQLIQRNHFLPWYRLSTEHWAALQFGRHRIVEFIDGQTVSRSYTTLKEFQNNVALQIFFLGTPIAGVNPERYERFRNDDDLQSVAIEAIYSWYREGTPNVKRRLAWIRMFCVCFRLAKEEGRSIEDVSMEGYEYDKNISNEVREEAKRKGTCLITPIIIEEMIKSQQ